MIKFFRHIRKNLLMENKTGKPAMPAGRYLKYAIGEIILVVIGILIALQVNNWNTYRNKKEQVVHYSKLLTEDISNDIKMIKESQFQAIKSFKRIDSLKSYMSSTNMENLSNTDLFVLTHDIMYKPFVWNRATLDEMKSSEIMQYFKNDSLKNKLIKYESFTYHLDEDFNHDLSNAQKAEEKIAEILNLNNTYFSDMLVLEQERFNDPYLNLFETELYQKAKQNELQLIIKNANDLKKFLNTFILIQDSYRIRAFLEMNEIIYDAEQIIQLIEKEN